MRSINVKRVAAIAAGAAMIGSVLATGALGAVQTSGDVNTLISNIKANLNDVQIAVGTNGAAISDGVQAAKIAAVLSSLNYESATIDPSAITISDKKVVVETTAGAGIEITPSVFSLELSGSTTNVGTANGYKTSIGNTTLTPLQLSDVLSQTQLSAYISGSVQRFKYQEEILLSGGHYAQYGEAGPTPSGHGLYLYAPYGTIQYRLNFQAAGQGLPTNGTAYNEVPEITVLGSKYAIDTTELTNGRLVLYSGAKQEILEGESVQVGDATITVTGIGQITSASGTTFTAIVKAEKGGTVQTQSIRTLSGFDFFAAQGEDAIVTVYVETIVYGAAGGSRVIARIGSNRIRFTEGQQFPLDKQWTVQSIDITGNQATNGLKSVTLKYGDPTKATPLERGIFDATVNNGLAQNVQIPGPKDANGNPTYYIELVGFGGATVNDQTEVVLEGVGLNTTSSTTSAIQATWTDRDGIVNEFKPPDRTYANLSSSATGTTGLTIGTVPYTIANDKVLYFSGIDMVTSGTATQYTPKFKIGGINGFELAATTNTSSTTPNATNPLLSTLAYTGGVSGNTLQCSIIITGTSTVTVNSTSASTCDLLPDVVVTGTKTTFDRAATNAPALNLVYTLGGFLMDNQNPRPAVMLNDTSGANAAYTLFVFDDTSTSGGNTSASGGGTYMGMQAYNTTVGNFLTTAGGNFSTTSAITYVDQAKSSPYEPDYYHVTQGGVTIDGSVSNRVTLSIPEAMPNVLVKVGSLVTPTNVSGEQTVAEGQTVGNVKIKEIQATVSGVPTGTYYTQKAPVLPESLITWDNAVTKTYTIVVGGPYVNNIAAGMAGASLITQAGAQYLVAEGNNLLVAGYLATDTAAAADELIRLLKA